MRRERSRIRSTVARRAMAGGLTLALGALGAIAAATGTSVPAWGAPRQPVAHAAHTLSVRDEGHLRFIKSSGSRLLDEGRITGSFPGWVQVHFTYNGEPEVSAQFTISGADGTISAHGTGRLAAP